MNRWEALYGVGMIACLFLPVFIALMGSSKHVKAAQEKAHARRIAEYKMNARLLRFDI